MLSHDIRMFCRAIRQPPLVGLGEEAVPPPLLHDPGDGLAVLLVMLHLLGRHRHEEPLFQPLGQFLEHLVLGAADEDRLRASAEIFDRLR